MTSKQVLDAFSETLMRDERILSSRERELLATLVQNAKAASAGNLETQSTVIAVIGRSVGETVAQRAFGLLGSSMVEQIVAPVTESLQAESMGRNGGIFAGPQPPGSSPRPAEPTEKPKPGPPPAPQGPQPPGITLTRQNGSRGWEAQQNQPVSTGSVGVLEGPEIEHAQCVVLDEFLAPDELKELIGYTLQRETEFRKSEVISPAGEHGVMDYSHRRSRVLMELGPHEEVILSRIRHVLPSVLQQLGMQEFPVTRTEAQITASNNGDFFRAHCDDAQEAIASRRLTFVYFFHREPKAFDGGELRLHDVSKDSKFSSIGSYETIKPQQNQIVFFPCSALHEITPVHCASQSFGDCRFTVNGWLHN